MSGKLDQELDVYLKLFVLRYADDTVLMAENANDLKTNSILSNSPATRLMLINYSSGRTPQKLKVFLLYDGKQLDIVDKFNYFGMTLTKCGSVLNAEKDRVC